MLRELAGMKMELTIVASILYAVNIITGFCQNINEGGLNKEVTPVLEVLYLFARALFIEIIELGIVGIVALMVIFYTSHVWYIFKIITVFVIIFIILVAITMLDRE